MDEQFSQEYIAFMQKAKALQALWVPGAGDWYLYLDTTRSMSPELVTGMTHAVVRDLKSRAKVRWLPSLCQLIRIIEGAGWDWKAERYHTRVSSQARYWVYAQNHALELYEDEISIDLMLATAKVAARVLEELAALGGKG